MANSIDQGQNLIDHLAEKFVERLRRGERPVIAEYAEQYPDLGERIRTLFPTLLLMEQLKPGSLDTLGGLPLADADAASSVAVPQLGDFRVIREVGRGGMGVVYEAEQVSLARRVALKVLSKRLLRDDLQRKRFQREARAAARLHHTNIVPVFGVGEQEDTSYYVMQFIQGQGLNDVMVELKRLRQPGGGPEAAGVLQADPEAVEMAQAMLSGIFRQHLVNEADVYSAEGNLSATYLLLASPSTPDPDSQTARGDTLAELSAATLSRSGAERHLGQSNGSGLHGSRSTYWRSVARIGQQVAEALEYAHGQGIVHRDIKPANLLLDTRGTVWVTDFGLAKAEDHEDLTQTGDVLGTLRYMAPEQFHGRGDARSDVYSLGMTLYELLVLRPAYEGTDRAQLAQMVLHESPPKLRALDPSIPRDLETIVHKAIDREPAHRYLSAAELADDLQRYLGDEPICARRVSLLSRLTRWWRKNRAVAMLSGLASSLLLLVLVVLTISQFQLTRQRNEIRDALVQSLISEARFRRTSGEIGQRADSLRKLTEAAQYRTSDDLRNEVIRCLALHDLDCLAEWPASSLNHSPDSIAFDPSLSHYVSYDNQVVEIRRTPASSGTPGVLVQSLSLGKGTPRVAKFSRDGRLFAVRVNDDDHSQLSIWNWREGRNLLTVNGVAERAFDMNLAGERVVCGLRDGTMKTYDLTTGAVLATWPLLNQPFDVRFEPRGPLIACTIPGANRVLIFDSRDGKIVHDLDCGEDIYAVAWHPAGDQLAVGHGFDVSITRLSNPQTPAATLTGHRWMIHALEYHPSGEFLVSHSLREGVTRLWDLRTRRELLVAPGHFVRFNVNGSHLAFVHSASLRLTRLLGEHEYQTLADPAEFNVDAWRAIPHPTLPVLVDCGRHGVRCWDIRRRRILAASPRETVYTVCFEPGTNDLLTAGEGGLQRWTLDIDLDATNTSLSSPKRLLFSDNSFSAPATDAFGLVCTADGRMRVAAFRGQPHLYVQDVPSGQVRRFPCDPMSAFIAVSSDGRWVAAGNYNSAPNIQVWDTRQLGDPRKLPVEGSAGQVTFSPDGQYLIACANDRYLLFKVGTWEVQSEIKRPSLISGSAAFSPDGRILALSMGPQEVQLRGVETGEILATLDAGRDPVNILNVTFHPAYSDSLILACGATGVRIWDLANVRKTLSTMHVDW